MLVESIATPPQASLYPVNASKTANQPPGLGDGDVLLADRAYDSDALRSELGTCGAWANIKPMTNRTRHPAFSAFLYRYRNLVERFFSKPKQFRAVATRYDKRDDNFLASIQLASIRIWLRHNGSVA